MLDNVDLYGLNIQSLTYRTYGDLQSLSGGYFHIFESYTVNFDISASSCVCVCVCIHYGLVKLLHTDTLNSYIKPINSYKQIKRTVAEKQK